MTTHKQMVQRMRDDAARQLTEVTSNRFRIGHSSDGCTWTDQTTQHADRLRETIRQLDDLLKTMPPDDV